MLKAFVAITEAGGEFLTSSTCAEFCDELKQSSSDSRNDDAEFWKRDDGQHSRPGVDLFLQNVKLKGEAVRKSGKRLKASVLVKKEGRSEQTRQVSLCCLLSAFRVKITLDKNLI